MVKVIKECQPGIQYHCMRKARCKGSCEWDEFGLDQCRGNGSNGNSKLFICDLCGIKLCYDCNWGHANDLPTYAPVSKGNTRDNASTSGRGTSSGTASTRSR